MSASLGTSAASATVNGMPSDTTTFVVWGVGAGGGGTTGGAAVTTTGAGAGSGAGTGALVGATGSGRDGALGFALDVAEVDAAEARLGLRIALMTVAGTPAFVRRMISGVERSKLVFDDRIWPRIT